MLQAPQSGPKNWCTTPGSHTRSECSQEEGQGSCAQESQVSAVREAVPAAVDKAAEAVAGHLGSGDADADADDAEPGAGAGMGHVGHRDHKADYLPLVRPTAGVSPVPSLPWQCCT